MIKDNFLRIKKDIDDACRLAGRKTDEVTLVGVTKFAPPEDIQEALQAGLTDIAENRVQEAQKKFPSLRLKFPNLRCHLIGHLQSNKARDAIKVCQWIQSVDSLKLAEELEKQAEKSNQTIEILVQFNTAREPQKFGADPDYAHELFEAISKLSHIKILGLMAMAPFTEDEGIIRKAFSDLRDLRDSIRINYSGHPRIQLNCLSMGMSSDYRIAIEEGSTMVRVGSAIFKKEI